jgi:hypothetical protein
MRAAWLMGVLLCMQVPLAGACGHCVEDKVAAVYDHAVVTEAQARAYPVVFFAIEGNLAPDAQRAIEDAARAAPGVDKDSVRVSIDQAALSMAFDPRKTSAETVRKAIAAKLSRKQLKLEELKVLQPTATAAPPAKS